jgi:coproporphyrinogen III oxidase
MSGTDAGGAPDAAGAGGAAASSGADLGARMHAFVLDLQDRITSGLEALDGAARFREDRWDRPGGGGGRSRVLVEGALFEKAGVNVSAVHGELPEAIARERGPADDRSFFATGVSLVLHPRSPLVPTVHANFRFLERGGSGHPQRCSWFGGGADLTPSYLFEEDAVHFHAVIRAACDRHDATYYPRFKRWCDEYFLVKHRGETRGVGGFFCDWLGAEAPPGAAGDAERERLFDFVRDAGGAFLDMYAPIVERRRALPFGERERRWQLLRRGRYAEFNLVYDRGTVFGLKTGGRVESILMSLPPLARWDEDHVPEPGSPEAALVEVLLRPREWLPSE